MNQKQREFLIKYVEKQHQSQIARLKENRPTEPNLNNYLVAAILDGSFQLKDVESIREFIRVKALELGPSNTLLDRKHNYRTREDGEFEVSLPADALFVLPVEYQNALARYKQAYDEWNSQMKQVDSLRDTLILKIQIGSDKVLERLIEQADNLADLQIVNTRLLLTEGQQSTGTAPA